MLLEGKAKHLSSCQTENAVQSSSSTIKAMKSSTYSRKFLDIWTQKFQWLRHDKEKDVAFCMKCSDAIQKLLITTGDKEAPFIKSTTSSAGFCNWKKAVERFRVHEMSSTHREAVLKLSYAESDINVTALLSTAKQRQMSQARSVLLKLFSSLRFLATQGLAIRGHVDDSSNYCCLLDLRSEDSNDMKTWISRKGVQYQWLSHDVQNEMLDMMGQDVLRHIVSKIKQATYFTVMIDESADISVTEQVSVCLRTVDDRLNIDEDFVGLYCTESTDSETLYNLVLDVFTRFDIDIHKCRGQCFDGASNVSGVHTGLQARLRTDEPRALFVHCYAHSLSLVLQDAIKNISVCRDVLNMMRDLITFVRSSPKRLAWFTSLQTENVNLRPFCPTRWTLRASSINSVLANIEELIAFMNDISATDKSEAGYKAKGFATQMCKFSNFFRVETAGQGVQPYRHCEYAHSGHSTKHSRWSVIY